MTLAEVPDADLRALLSALDQGRVTGVTATHLAPSGFGDLARHLTAFATLDRGAVAAIVRAVLEERDRRRGPELQLVWTGPEPQPAVSRDTAVVVHDLFRQAQSHVLIAGFSFTDGATILQPLHEALLRGVKADMFLHLELKNRTVAVTIQEELIAKNWPFGPPLPAVYYDPRCELPKPKTSLHAKCVVIDGRHTLITSANFTYSGQERNIELGVLIDDVVFAARVLEQWRRLVNDGLLLRYV